MFQQLTRKSTMKIVTVLGARPQFVKASVVTAAFSRTLGMEEVVVHTGQHFDANMSDVFFAELACPCLGYQLDIHGGGHGEMTGRMLIEMEKVLLEERPDAVMVYGDTNSTLAGSLAAIKLHIPVAHVEAGLRSFNMAHARGDQPHAHRPHLALAVHPDRSVDPHLDGKAIRSGQILHVGDVMYDVALHHGAQGRRRRDARRLGLQPGAIVLATLHRAENTDDPQRMGNSGLRWRSPRNPCRWSGRSTPARVQCCSRRDGSINCRANPPDRAGGLSGHGAT